MIGEPLQSLTVTNVGEPCVWSARGHRWPGLREGSVARLARARILSDPDDATD